MEHIIVEEFSAGLPSAEQLVRVTIRLVTAMILGAVIGYERERTGKAAGLRTHMLVALGSALFVLIPLEAGSSIGDVTRVIQGVATGIGFVGAGAILKRSDEHEVRGITTAAGIWLTAAVGIAAGLGRLGTASLSVLLAWVILKILGPIETWIHRQREEELQRGGHTKEEEHISKS